MSIEIKSNPVAFSENLSISVNGKRNIELFLKNGSQETPSTSDYIIVKPSFVEISYENNSTTGETFSSENKCFLNKLPFLIENDELLSPIILKDMSDNLITDIPFYLPTNEFKIYIDKNNVYGKVDIEFNIISTISQTNGNQTSDITRTSNTGFINIDVLYFKINGSDTGPGPDPPRTWTRSSGQVETINKIVNEGKITFEELNERRKAEIFKYKKNSANINKKNAYAYLAKGNKQRGQSFATQGESFTDPNIRNLPIVNDSLVSKSSKVNYGLTTQNDTPGTVQKIALKPQVPLYNYLINRTYPGNSSLNIIEQSVLVNPIANNKTIEINELNFSNTIDLDISKLNLNNSGNINPNENYSYFISSITPLIKNQNSLSFNDTSINNLVLPYLIPDQSNILYYINPNNETAIYENNMNQQYNVQYFAKNGYFTSSIGTISFQFNNIPGIPKTFDTEIIINNRNINTIDLSGIDSRDKEVGLTFFINSSSSYSSLFYPRLFDTSGNSFGPDICLNYPAKINTSNNNSQHQMYYQLNTDNITAQPGTNEFYSSFQYFCKNRFNVSSNISTIKLVYGENIKPATSVVLISNNQFFNVSFEPGNVYVLDENWFKSNNIPSPIIPAGLGDTMSANQNGRFSTTLNPSNERQEYKTYNNRSSSNTASLQLRFLRPFNSVGIWAIGGGGGGSASGTSIYDFGGGGGAGGSIHYISRSHIFENDRLFIQIGGGGQGGYRFSINKVYIDKISKQAGGENTLYGVNRTDLDPLPAYKTNFWASAGDGVATRVDITDSEGSYYQHLLDTGSSMGGWGRNMATTVAYGGNANYNGGRGGNAYENRNNNDAGESATNSGYIYYKSASSTNPTGVEEYDHSGRIGPFCGGGGSSGKGGNSIGGRGGNGKGGLSNSAPNSSVTGEIGQVPGAGGGGGAQGNSQVSDNNPASGGAGASGCVIIYIPPQ